MTQFRGCAGFAVFAILAGGFLGTADAQWRGHYVHRSGPHGHEVERYRWGGGITPTGGAVLMRGIDMFGPMVGGLITAGKSAEDASEAKSLEKSSLGTCEAYAQAQQEANALLVRTAALVNKLPPRVTDTDRPVVVGGRPKARGDALTPQERDPKMFGENPWGVDPLP